MVLPLPKIPTPKPFTPSIPTNLLRAGRSEYLTGKAANLAQMSANATAEGYFAEELEGYTEQEQWENMAKGMRQPQQEQQEPGKFMSMLGKVLKPLEPLKYLDIPIELAAEAVIDPLEMALPGNQFNWLRGSAKREHFEGWKSVFEGIKGEKSLIDVMDDVADAFEKRPFLAQVGLGFAYGIPVSRVGNIRRLGKFAKPLMYSLDPAQVAWDYGVSPLAKKAWRAAGRGAKPVLMAVPTDPAQIKTIYDDINAEYRVDEGKYARNADGEYVDPKRASDPYTVSKHTKFISSLNSLSRLRKGLSGGTIRGDADIIVSEGLQQGSEGVSDLAKHRDLALLDLEQALFGREGQIEHFTLAEMESFLIDGTVPLKEASKKTGVNPKRAGLEWVEDEGSSLQAMLSGQRYINTLKDTLDDKSGKTLYELLKDNPDESIWHVVYKNVEMDGTQVGAEEIGIGKYKSGRNILTDRLRFYNKEYGAILGDFREGIEGGIEHNFDQPLPMNSQSLRHIAATRLMSQDGIRPIDIQHALRHSVSGSPTEWRNYVIDPDVFDVREDAAMYYGLMGNNNELSGGYAQTHLGVKLIGAKVSKEAKELGTIAKDVIDITDPATKDMLKNLDIVINGKAITEADAVEIIEKFMIQRSSMEGLGPKKGLYESASFETPIYRDYVQLMGEIRIQKILKDDMIHHEIKTDIDNLKRSDMLTQEQEDILRLVGANRQMRQEGVDLYHGHQRMRGRMQVIERQLERQGWLEKKGKKWRLRSKEEGPIKAKRDASVKALGQGNIIQWEEAYRMWGPTNKGDEFIPYEKLGWTDEGTHLTTGERLTPSDYQQSYGALERQTKKVSNQLHMHEIMIAATRNHQRKVLSLMRQNKISAGDIPDTSPLHNPKYSWMMQDGLHDADYAGLPNGGDRNYLGDPFWHEAIAGLSGSATKAQKSYGQIRNEVRAPLVKIIVARNDLNGIEGLNLDDVDSLKVAEDKIRAWLGGEHGPQVINALEGKGLRAGDSQSEITKALWKAYNALPQIFGTDVQAKTRFDKATGKYVSEITEEEVDKRIKVLSRILSSQSTDGGSAILMQANVKGATSKLIPLNFEELSDEWGQHVLKRRKFRADTGVDIHDRMGVTAADVTGWMPDLNTLTAQISDLVPGNIRRGMLGLNEDGTQKAGRNWYQRHLGGNLNSFVSGGARTGGIRKATKLFVGRRKGFALSERIAKELVRDLNIKLHSQDSTLGFMTDSATKGQRASQETRMLEKRFESVSGAKGHQFFGKLEDKIRGIEWNDAGTDITGKFEDGTRMSPKTERIIRDALSTAKDNRNLKATGKDFFNDTGTYNGDVRKLLTQVDAVLEEGGPELWDELYRLDEAGAEWAELQFLRNITAEMDVKAAARGFNIPDMLKAKGVTYLEGGYVPRLSRQGSRRIAESKDNVDAISNNTMEWFLEERKDQSIFHSMKRDANTMEDLTQRLGQYVETVNKSMLDVQLNTELKRLYDENYITPHQTATYDVEMLDSFRIMMEDLQAGISVPTEASDKHWRRVLNGEWGHMEDLQTHVKNMLDSDHRGLLDYVAEHADDIEMARETYRLSQEEILGEYSDVNKWFKNQGFDANERWMEGLVLTEEDLFSIRQQYAVSNEGITGFLAWGAKKARGPARFMRTFKAGFDAGVLLIHGYNSLVANPIDIRDGKITLDWTRQKSWFKAANQMGRFLVSPEGYDTYMATDKAVRLRQEMMPFVTLGHSEPLAAAQNSNTFLRWRQQLGGVKGVKELKVAHRAEAAFVGTLDVLRMELWQGMMPTVRRDYDRLVQSQGYPAWTDDLALASKEQHAMMTDFGTVVNKMTGVYDSDLSMLTPTQGIIENSFLFFAPMYRRATYSVMADLARPGVSGIRRRAAFDQLSGVVTAGLLMGAISEHMLGNDGAGTPDSGNFGKFMVGGQKMGIGTAWYTAFRLAGDIGWGEWADPEKDDVYDYLKDNPVFSALGRRGRSQLAPPASMAIDMITGKSFIGEPLIDNDGSRDWSAHALYAGRSVMPFWADSIIAGKPVGGLAEAMGLQSLPISEYDTVVNVRQYLLEEEDGLPELNRWRNGKKATGEKLIWSELPNKIRLSLETNNMQLVDAMSSYKERWGEFARGDDRQWVEYNRRKGDINLNATQMLSRLTTQFEKGQISGRKLQEEIRAIKQYRRVSTTSLVEDSELPAVHQRLSELKEARSEKDIVYQGDTLYNLYIRDVVDNDANFDSDGNYVFDNYRSNLVEFKRAHNLNDRPELWKYIQDRKAQWYENNPVMVELDAAKQVLEPYWNIHQKIFTNPTDRAKASMYMSALTPREKAILTAKDPSMKHIAARIKKERQAMRLANPSIDWYLTKYHGARPITTQAQQREQIWGMQQRNARVTDSVRTLDSEGFRATPAGRVVHSSLTGA